MKKNEVRKKIVKQMKMNGYADVEEKDDSTIYAYKVNVPGLLFETSGMMIMIDYSALSFYGFYNGWFYILLLGIGYWENY